MLKPIEFKKEKQEIAAVIKILHFNRIKVYHVLHDFVNKPLSLSSITWGTWFNSLKTAFALLQYLQRNSRKNKMIEQISKKYGRSWEWLNGNHFFIRNPFHLPHYPFQFKLNLHYTITSLLMNRPTTKRKYKLII